MAPISGFSAAADQAWRYGMTRGKPVLDPERDLKGATPETLARALLRRVEPLRSRAARKTVVGDEVAVEEVSPNQPGDGVPHLRKRP